MLATIDIPLCSVIAVDLMNIRECRPGKAQTQFNSDGEEKQILAPELVIKFCEDLSALNLKNPIIYLCDHLYGDIPSEFKRNPVFREWFETRRDLEDDNPEKIWMTQSRQIKADYAMCDLHNRYRALLVTRDELRAERLGPVPLLRDDSELKRFAGIWNEEGLKFEFVGQSPGCWNVPLAHFDLPTLSKAEIETIRSRAIETIRPRVKTLTRVRLGISALTQQIGEIFAGKTFEGFDEPAKQEPIIEEARTVPRKEKQIVGVFKDVPRQAPVLVKLFDRAAMRNQVDLPAVVIGVPRIDPLLGQLQLSWFENSAILYLSEESRRLVYQKSEIGQLIAVTCEYKSLGGDAYEVTMCHGVARVQSGILFAVRNHATISFSSWGLPRWRSIAKPPGEPVAVESVDITPIQITGVLPQGGKRQTTNGNSNRVSAFGSKPVSESVKKPESDGESQPPPNLKEDKPPAPFEPRQGAEQEPKTRENTEAKTSNPTTTAEQPSKKTTGLIVATSGVLALFAYLINLLL